MIPLSNLKTSVIIAGTSLAVGAASAWWLTAEYKENKYQAVLAQMELDAQKALNDAKDKALAVERENNRIAQELEVQNAKHRQELAKLENELRGYVNELGGLYDRYATCSNPSVPANAGTTPQPTSPPAGAKLSKQLEGLLLSESRRADEAAAYAQTCYQWIQKLREANK